MNEAADTKTTQDSNAMLKALDWLYEKAAIVDDDVELEDIWILELSTGNDRSRENFEMEFVTDILFTHEPTKDEILRAMVVHGMSIYRDVAIVRHGYRIR
jgi:hypothetical protein